MKEVFKTNVVDYCTLDDKIKEYNVLIKETKEKQKMLSESIMEYMSRNSLEVCNAGQHGILSLKTTVTKSGVNKDTIKESLAKILNDHSLMSADVETIAENGSELIMNNRETSERNVIKRSRMKK